MTARASQSSLAQMHADAVLAADIVPEHAAIDIGQRAVLVSGATGFLGRYVVARLLQTTDGNLVLLARAKAGQSAQDRVAATLAGIGIDLAAYAVRVRVIEGDVTQERFALDRDLYAACAAQVDTIYHCSAAVDWVRDYGRLRQTNVEGVRHMIRFACTGRTKRIVFSSSIAVCMFSEDAGHFSETTPVMPHVAKMPLGYARSKAVAEALLHHAAARGVPVTIIRPPLISGHSRTGHSNASDIFAALLQACVQTGQGPDIDWRFDITPVDYVAQVFTDVPQRGQASQVLNLKQPDARTWGNLLTWMNLHGYRVDRVATDDWIAHLFDHAAARGAMLYTQRQYFAGRPARAGETGWVRPFAAYLSDSYARVNGDATMAVLAEHGIGAPLVDIDLLHAYFRDLRRAGVLPDRPQKQADCAIASFAVQFPDYTVRRIGQESGILNQLAASSAQGAAGVWVLEHRNDPSDKMVVKLKPAGSVLRDQSAVLAGVASPALGTLFRKYGDPFALEHSHAREQAIYRHPPRGLAVVLPQVRDVDAAFGPDVRGLVMEHITEAEKTGPQTWIGSRDPAFRHVQDGLAAIHNVAFDRVSALDPLIRPVPTPTMAQMSDKRPLWQGLAKLASGRMPDGTKARHQHILETLDDWWPDYAALPQTLVHNDFNPRNFVLRSDGHAPRLCVYDWEIAGTGPPQRDLAELLCFSLAADTDAAHLDEILTRQRTLLETAAGIRIDHHQWCYGVHLAAQYILLSRLPLYVLIDDLQTLPFLPDLIHNCMTLIDKTLMFCPAKGANLASGVLDHSNGLA